MAELVTLIDAHVHLRPTHNPAAVLDGAVRHFARASTRLGASRCEGVLLLAEAVGEHGFDRLAAGDGPVGRWRVQAAGDPLALRCQRDDESWLWLIRGRQVATRQGLEVLTLLSAAEIPDGLGIEETIERGLAQGALVTLPWGFGKWTGGRKKLMLDLVRAYAKRGVALGDSAARPVGLGESAVLGLGRRMGMPILPGTDPLPIPTHQGRAGQYGLWLAGELDHQSPSADLRRRLSTPASGDAIIGQRDGPMAAVLTQIRLRLQ